MYEIRVKFSQDLNLNFHYLEYFVCYFDIQLYIRTLWQGHHNFKWHSN